MSTTLTLQIEHRRGDLFHYLPENAVLVHAFNARGVWSTGVARTLRERYPSAFECCKAYCKSSNANELLGEVLLAQAYSTSSLMTASFIGCLFTRIDWGAPTAAEREHGYEKGVLEATETAMQALFDEVAERCERARG